MYYQELLCLPLLKKKKKEWFSGNLFISFLVSFHRIVAIHIFNVLFTTRVLNVFENSMLEDIGRGKHEVSNDWKFAEIGAS